jgi:mRNA interferase MazF
MRKPKTINEWFARWAALKIHIHLWDRLFYFREGEIWWANLGANIGSEINGKNHLYERPILVIKKFNKRMMWAIPLTSKSRLGQHYIQIAPGSTAVLSQLRLLSSSRLIRKSGVCLPSTLAGVRSSLVRLLN